MLPSSSSSHVFLFFFYFLRFSIPILSIRIYITVYVNGTFIYFFASPSLWFIVDVFDCLMFSCQSAAVEWRWRWWLYEWMFMSFFFIIHQNLLTDDAATIYGTKEKKRRGKEGWQDRWVTGNIIIQFVHSIFEFFLKNKRKFEYPKTYEYLQIFLIRPII